MKRLVYADENDNVFPIQMNTEKEKQYYLNDIKADIKYYEKVYEKIENKFKINGKLPNKATDNLVRYIDIIKNRKEN